MRFAFPLKLAMVALVLATPFTAAAAGKCDRLVATGAADNPPFLWRDPQNPKRLIGANADLLGQIADSLDLKLDLLYTGDRTKALEEVRSGRVDVLADATLTVQRLEELDFVHPAILQLQTVAWVRNEPGFFYASREDLGGHAGLIAGTTRFGREFAAFATKYLQSQPVADLAQGLKRVKGESLGLLGLIDPLLDRVVRAKVRARFGGRLKGIMSGGARLDPEIGRFFLALGLPVMQGYGQTEAGPVVAANPPDRIRIDTAGRPLPNVELRIAEDGEIMVRGNLVMQGYWGNEEATKAAITEDGWLHTGDVGALDADGYLRITDRKKDFIKTNGGDMVSPARVEGMLMQQPGIAQAVVAGDGRPHLVALIVPAEGTDEVAVTLAVEAANKRLAVAERVRKWRLVEPFTIENGMMTPTQKIRRPAVLGEFREAISGLYR